MEKKEADPKYFTALQKIQTLLLRLETEMSKVFQHNATSKPEKWIEHLHQCQNVLTLCSDELCSWLTFWGLDNLGEKFRLLYHIHKTHINFMLNDYIHIFKKLQSNAFVEMNGVQFENSYQKLHEKVIYRQKPKQELLTMNVFEFQDQERAREIEEADRKAEEERKQRERTSRAEAEMALNKEINHVVDLRPIKTEDIAITPSILVDEGSGMIKRLIQIHENSAKDLESFLRDRKNLPKHKIEALMNHLTDMLDKAATGGEIIDSESDDLHDAFVESLKDKEEFRQTLETFDQKQRDLIVRALVYYRKLNTKVKIDKATEPDLKIFDLDEAIHEQERLGRVINELEKENREKYGTIKNLKINLDSKTELLQKSVDKNRSLEAELASFKSQIELFRKELSDKNNVLYGQAEKVVQLKDQEKIANDLKTELKKAESKLETTTRELTALKEEVALSKSRRDDSTFLDSFQIESRERNKTMFIGNKNIDLRAADLEIEDRQRSKSMSPVKTDFQQPAAMEPQDKDTKILSQDVLDSPKKKLEINLVQIEESNSSVVQSSGQTTPVEPKIEPKRTISPLKKKVSAIANFRGQETKKGNALEEILKKQGLEDDSSMIMESIKDEINGKRSLPLRTMSLADFNPANENIPKLPRLMAKPRSRKNDIHKRMNQKGEYMRSLSPIKHARNGAGPVAELAALQAEKEKAYQALVERSLGLYKPLPQIRFNTLQKYKGLNERKSGRELGGSFEVDSYKSGEKGVYDLAKSAYNLQGGNQDYVPQDGDAITTGSAWRSNKEQNLNYSVDKQKHFYPSCVSLQSSGLDLEEIVTAKSKNMAFNNIVSEREVEALYAFLLHDSESAASKLNLMQNMLKIKPEDKKNDSPMEKDIKGSSSLKNVENFKEAVKEWLIEHRTCGQECPHLQRFYDKINFRKQFADIMLPRENTKKVMKIPLAVLAGPLPAETQDTGRKRYKGTL